MKSIKLKLLGALCARLGIEIDRLDDMDIEQDGLGLSEALETLRAELERSSNKGKDAALQVVVQDVKLELSLVAAREANGGAAIKWFVLSADASASLSDVKTQKVTLTVQVIDKNTNEIARVEGQAGPPGT